MNHKWPDTESRRRLKNYVTLCADDLTGLIVDHEQGNTPEFVAGTIVGHAYALLRAHHETQMTHDEAVDAITSALSSARQGYEDKVPKTVVS